MHEEDKKNNVRNRTPAQWKQFEAAEARNRQEADGITEDGDKKLDIQNGTVGQAATNPGEKGVKNG